MDFCNVEIQNWISDTNIKIILFLSISLWRLWFTLGTNQQRRSEINYTNYDTLYPLPTSSASFLDPILRFSSLLYFPTPTIFSHLQSVLLLAFHSSKSPQTQTQHEKWTTLIPYSRYTTRKGPWYPLDGRLCGPQSESGRRGKRKNSLPLYGIKSIIQSTVSHYTDRAPRHHALGYSFSCVYIN